jgi:hypothetical protein
MTKLIYVWLSLAVRQNRPAPILLLFNSLKDETASQRRPAASPQDVISQPAPVICSELLKTEPPSADFASL